ncbi:hypothetical protein FA048_04760 [Pedobacter polaris]|uniref:Outer membrane protein beta-barrel domain-containing protein n=1 Tax=Pedobacter polaris TaxID=2571273 RepID=A0A4V5P0G4_9SPHI|nr:hypothetical protein [Pedobacter polaris]TKC12932.1 hypothetical protein FA048_04760 [Pedobacter polaris]
MKSFFLLTFLTFISIASIAQQNGAYSKGDNLLNIGIGINSSYSGGLPIGASYEKGITDDISVGANFDYLSNKYLTYKFTAIYFGARGSYHFNNLLKIQNNKLDLYGGATLGYRSFSWSDSEQNIGDEYGSGVFLGAYIGGKYYFGNAIGVFTELGEIGSTNARVGVAFKF